MDRRTEVDQYIEKHPVARKWLRTCRLCGSTGYDPGMPEQLLPHFSVLAKNIRRDFQPLELSEDGTCEVCGGVSGGV